MDSWSELVKPTHFKGCAVSSALPLSLAARRVDGEQERSRGASSDGQIDARLFPLAPVPGPTGEVDRVPDLLVGFATRGFCIASPAEACFARSRSAASTFTTGLEDTARDTSREAGNLCSSSVAGRVNRTVVIIASCSRTTEPLAAVTAFRTASRPTPSDMAEHVCALNPGIITSSRSSSVSRTAFSGL
eukprot:scaffold249442_cov28-Tisochrysis_lutea.AAC.2